MRPCPRHEKTASILLGTLILILAMGSGACAMPLQARTAEVLAPGRGQFGGQIGGSFGSSKLPDAIPPEMMANWAFSGRLGVAPRVEILAEVGWLRQLGAARLDLFNARRGSPVSLALMAQGGGKVVAERDAGSPDAEATRWGYEKELGCGVDLSVPLWDILEPTMNLGLSRGAQWYHVPKTDPYLGLEESHYLLLNRTETRLELTFGLALHVTPERVPLQIILGVTPYWIVDTPGVPGAGDPHPDGVTFSLSVTAALELWHR